MGYYSNGNRNNMIILIILLVVVGIVAWSAIRKNKENLTGPFNEIGRRRGVNYVPEEMPEQAILEPEFDYETLYGGANDNFGTGAGASSLTTNDLTLL